MASLEAVQQADDLAQAVIDAWNKSAENARDFTPAFKSLLHKTFLYRSAEQIADNHRAFDILSEGDEAREQAARLGFMRAYKIYCDSHNKEGIPVSWGQTLLPSQSSVGGTCRNARGAILYTAYHSDVNTFSMSKRLCLLKVSSSVNFRWP